MRIGRSSLHWQVTSPRLHPDSHHCLHCCRLGMARELHFEDSHKQAAMKALDLGAMQYEIEQMEATCTRLESPVVWSHNDLLSGNVMVAEQVRGWPGVRWPAKPPQLRSQHDLHRHADVMMSRGAH